MRQPKQNFNFDSLINVDYFYEFEVLVLTLLEILLCSLIVC